MMSSGTIASFPKIELTLMRGIDAHQAWVKSGGRDGERLTLVGVDLRGVDLRNEDLRRANFALSDLRCADLVASHLGGANLLGADLSGADLTCAQLDDVELGATRVERARVDARGLRGATFDGVPVELRGVKDREAR